MEKGEKTQKFSGDPFFQTFLKNRLCLHFFFFPFHVLGWKNRDFVTLVSIRLKSFYFYDQNYKEIFSQSQLLHWMNHMIFRTLSELFKNL